MNSVLPAPPAASAPSDELPAPTFNRDHERMHRQMLSAVSHDLKTPLVSIIGSLEVLERMRDKLSPDKIQTLVQVALQESYRLDTFINNILDMAKIDNNMLKPRMESAELGAVLRNCTLKIEGQLRGANVSIKAGETLVVTTDPVLLSRVIALILDNAIKYGTAPNEITIKYGVQAPNIAHIDILDNGRGIPEGQHEAIFSKYTRFAKQDQQNAGTGLGLAISRGIMNLLGGTIRASSPASGGALFSLTLPLR